MNSYKLKAIKFPKEIKTLVIGDSHILMAVDDKKMDGVVNIAQHSEGYVYSYYKLEKILNTNPQIKNIVLGLSYHNLSAYYDKYLYLPAVSAQYYFITPLSWQFNVVKENKTEIGDLIKRVFKTGFNNTFNQNYSFIGKYDNEIVQSNRIYDSIINKRLKFQYYNDKGVNGISITNEYYLLKIITMCKQRNINLIVLNTALHNGYLQKVPFIFKKEYHRVLLDNNLHSIDFSKLQMPDSCYLPDGDHVSKSGAIIMTSILNDSLKLFP